MPTPMVTRGVTDQGRDEDVDLRLFGDQFAGLRGQDGDDEDRQRSARSAQRVGRKADDDEREQDEGRRLQRVADGGSHGGAGHRRAQRRHAVLRGTDGGDRLHEEIQMELGAQCRQDGAHEERTEETLCHGTERVDAIASQRDLNIFFLQKLFD